MALRRSMEETVVVRGGRDEWLTKCSAALEGAGFRDVAEAPVLGQVTAALKRPTLWGDIVVTLTPHGSDSCQLRLVSTANVDNIYALFSSPNKRVLKAAKEAMESAR